MFTIKSIFAIIVTVFMTVSVIQAMPVNEMPSLPESEPIEFMSYKNNDSESPFTIYDIQFTDNPYEVKGVHYIKGTQHSQPITLVCEPNSNTNNPAFQVYKDLMLDPKSVKSDRFLVPVPEKRLIIKGNVCYIIPGQCEMTYKDFAQKYTSGARLVQLLWQNIGSGLDAIKEAGWYSHMDFKDICMTSDNNNNTIPSFFNFNNAIPVGKGLVNIEDTNNFVVNSSLLLVSKYVKSGIMQHIMGPNGKEYEWRSLKAPFNSPAMSNWSHGPLYNFKYALNTMLLKETEN
ncbi:hypothetical protein BDF19DRAFT_410321 [Syncephalis fuscata]|nr:hypothetical protein BDF19DRAFT_410321 [Syncephalis fuscata]